jgi:hypothetical protein
LGSDHSRANETAAVIQDFDNRSLHRFNQIQGTILNTMDAVLHQMQTEMNNDVQGCAETVHELQDELSAVNERSGLCFGILKQQINAMTNLFTTESNAFQTIEVETVETIKMTKDGILKSTELLGAKGKQESDERLKNHTELIR